MLACAHPTFDCPVILFQNIIEVLHRSMPAIFLQSTHGFEPHDGWRITDVLVGVATLPCRHPLTMTVSAKFPVVSERRTHALFAERIITNGSWPEPPHARRKLPTAIGGPRR